MKTPPYDDSPPEGVFLFAICNVLGVGLLGFRSNLVYEVVLRLLNGVSL
jgi:hypothetical protein